MTTISLQEITAANWRATLQLSVRPEQQAFVAEYTPIAALVLAKAYVRPGGLHWVPYLVSSEQTPVGMFALAYQPEQADSYWLYHLFIDQHHQGKGYGPAALRAAFDLIEREHPQCRTLNITVHPDNQRAQQLYARLGFVPTGERLHGELHYQRAFATTG